MESGMMSHHQRHLSGFGDLHPQWSYAWTLLVLHKVVFRAAARVSAELVFMDFELGAEGCRAWGLGFKIQG